MARNLIFFGFSEEDGGSGGRDDANRSFFAVARMMRLHLQRWFRTDSVEIVYAWNEDSFVRTLMTPGPNIRQNHYCGHVSGGSLSFSYHNATADPGRCRLVAWLTASHVSRLPDAVKRWVALRNDPSLLSGFFSTALEPAKLAAIRARLTADAQMHVWGCFAGAREHPFDPDDDHWNLFNPDGVPASGIARELARALQINLTAVHDPRRTHGMNFCLRDARGVVSCPNFRRRKAPQWQLPAARSVGSVTRDPAGNANEINILFLGKAVPASKLKPGRPSKWFTDEIPRALARVSPPALPACSAAAVGFYGLRRTLR